MTRDELCEMALTLQMSGLRLKDIKARLKPYYNGKQAEPTRGWASRLIADAKRKRDAWPQVAEQQTEAGQLRPRSNGVIAGEVVEPFATYTFKGQDESDYKLPIFDGEPHVTGDWMVVGDVHLPTTDYKLARLMLDTARKIGIKKLLIVGDLINADAYSRYDALVEPPPFQVEIKAAVKLVAEWAEWFDDILMVLGNHEHRLFKYNAGRINADWMGHILNAGRGVLRVSPYSQIVITSGGEKWRATHQANYSRIPGRIGSLLAQKYQCNIISFHQHHVAKLRDTFNRYTVIDGGGLFDDSMMAYVKLTDNTSPVMARGFTVLCNGTGHLMTPYGSFTDLDVLVAGLSVQRALRA